MPLRSIADIEADYAAVRAAWLRAVDAASHSSSSGDASYSIARQNVDSLAKQMKALEAEYDRRSNGSGLRVQYITPSDD